MLEADKVMQAIGFAPRTEGYGLDKAGVELTERGAVDIDDYMRTNVPHIYAIGDCTGEADAGPHGRGAGRWSPPRRSPARRPCRSTTT